ncbi:hypothetical protein [Thalassococcus profundi]|uniref:hypothetical protein n=1 Tax=Thalassococcus profundi TaxID=2282382 RepID=UPI0040593707
MRFETGPVSTKPTKDKTMTEMPHVGAEPQEFGIHPDDRCRFGTDLQDRFGFLLLGFNAAHFDLLEARKIGSIRRTEEPDIFEVEIGGLSTVSTLTTAVICEEGELRLEPIDFRNISWMPLSPVFSYDGDCADAYIIRLMTCWLEKSFLIHEPAILEAIRALPPSESTIGA